MVISCCAYGCTNEWTPLGNIKFHKFPMKNPERLKLWIQALRRKNCSPSAFSVLCSEHFKTEDYLESSLWQNMLKRDAVSSIFRFPEHMAKHSPKKRRPLSRKEFLIEEQDLPEKEETSVCDVATQTLHFKTRTEIKLRKQLKNTKLKVRRRNVKLTSMNNLIKHLKNNKKCFSNIEDVLLHNFEGFQLDLFRNEVANGINNKTQKRYTEEMRNFALTLNFYSPRAYAFVRNKLNLPHSATLRKWLSSFNCEVGFLSEVFEYLKQSAINNDYLSDVALVFDSMAIYSAVVYDKKTDRHYGYVDMGGIGHLNSEELATEALVFQIVSFTTKFKCPIAYFFVNKITATVQKQLILLAIEKLFQIGISVRSVTCDGCATNIKTLTLLGCNLSPDNIIPSFKNPLSGNNIFCILDPCHMLKLLRNAFGEISLSSSKGPISFKYIQNLHDLQEQQDLKFANKLSACHVKYKQKKMNVRLAGQTISSSVANAIEFLLKMEHPDFIGSEATIEFLRVFDRIFDLMNSRSMFAKGFKSPIYLHNKEIWSNIFKETKKYILDLRADGIQIIHHRRKTFAIGFLVNIISFENIAKQLLEAKDRPLKYLLTYKCSQDHLELFFACIRSRGGWNDNPNALQFKWTLRRLLFNNSVQAGLNSNCIGSDFDVTPICESRTYRTILNNDQDRTETDKELNKLISLVDSTNLTSLQENILYYIAGFIVRKLLLKTSCIHCKEMLLKDVNMHEDHNYHKEKINYASFTKFVNQGKLYFPKEVVFNIVHYTEKVFMSEVNLYYLSRQNFKQRMTVIVLQQFLDNLTKIFQPPHPVVDMYEDLHEVQVTKFIINNYANLRIQTHAKKETLRVLGDKATIRHKLHKQILFYHV